MIKLILHSQLKQKIPQKASEEQKKIIVKAIDIQKPLTMAANMTT